MEFKIKPKWHIKGPLMALVLMVFLTGILLGGSILKEQPNIKWVLLIILFFLFATGILQLFSSFTRRNSSIEIDSFTEDAINEKVEERWREIEKIIMGHK